MSDCEKSGCVKPISCDVKKSSRERLSLVFGYTASIWSKGCHRNWRTMRTGIIRCVSSRAFADALSCSNSRLFAVRQFGRSIVLDYGMRTPLHFPWCRAIDGIRLLRKCCSLNSALKHESRIVSGVGTNVIRQVSEAIPSLDWFQALGDRSKLFDDQRSYLFTTYRTKNCKTCRRGVSGRVLWLGSSYALSCRQLSHFM